MISGAVDSPAWETTIARMTDESGSPSTDTVAAPISAATAGVSANPTCEASRPATIPRNIAGNVGPPRALPSEMA